MSKPYILISLLIILISACTQRVAPVTPEPEQAQSTLSASSNTIESVLTLPTITVSPDFAATEEALPPHPTFVPTITLVDTTTAVFSACPGAPGPYVALGNQVTVVTENDDKLKLRSEPTISPETVKSELNRFTPLQIVGGPICVRDTESSYWFWQVKVHPGGETGWVAEGDVQRSFIVVSTGEQYLPSTATAYTATTPSACPGSHAPFAAGMQVIVIAADSDKLKLRSKPEISPNTVLRELDQFTSLQIVGGPVCVSSSETGGSYWLWKVKVISSGKTGWVAEGDGQNYFLESNAP